MAKQFSKLFLIIAHSSHFGISTAQAKPAPHDVAQLATFSSALETRIVNSSAGRFPDTTIRFVRWLGWQIHGQKDEKYRLVL
jgi:hypothetical protein